MAKYSRVYGNSNTGMSRSAQFGDLLPGGAASFRFVIRFVIARVGAHSSRDDLVNSVNRMRRRTIYSRFRQGTGRFIRGFWIGIGRRFRACVRGVGVTTTSAVYDTRRPLHTLLRDRTTCEHQRRRPRSIDAHEFDLVTKYLIAHS